MDVIDKVQEDVAVSTFVRHIKSDTAKPAVTGCRLERSRLIIPDCILIRGFACSTGYIWLIADSHKAVNRTATYMGRVPGAGHKTHLLSRCLYDVTRYTALLSFSSACSYISRSRGRRLPVIKEYCKRKVIPTLSSSGYSFMAKGFTRTAASTASIPTAFYRVDDPVRGTEHHVVGCAYAGHPEELGPFSFGWSRGALGCDKESKVNGELVGKMEQHRRRDQLLPLYNSYTQSQSVLRLKLLIPC
jgi:hypothetical protein